MALVVRSLRKTYGEQTALDGIDLTLTDSVIALLGANGSGKSTLLRILATLVKPDAGEVTFDGLSYARDERSLRAQIGYLPQALELPEMLTPRRLLNHLARLRGATLASIAPLRLEALLDQPFHKLSGGQQRLVGIAQAFLGAPRLVLLDEFARGLDVSERERAFRMIGQQGALMIFSTHIPAEIESVGAQQVIVLDRGRVLFCGTVESMRTTALGRVYEISIPNEQVPALAASQRISSMSSNGSQTSLRIIGMSNLTNLNSVTPTLEDAYLFITGT
ncbi:MAG: ABC transporter ATP-binding protein [Anaerolineae bacterium]|nr:ABC transporter ATP-binding protein [Anaerolineae bacterium]